MSKNIVRVNKTKNYTVMSNTHLRDKRLSWKAKGIHSYVLSLPDDWKIILEHLKTVSTDGEKSLRSGLDELYDLKYWQKYPVYIDGKVGQWITEIYEEPFNDNEKIKSVVFKDGKKITKYENNTVQVESMDINLLPQNGEVDELIETTDVDLLPQKVEVGNVEVEKVDVEKDGLLNTNITKDLSFTNHSFNQEDGENENIENEYINKFEKILKQIEFNSLEENRKNAVNQSIRFLVYGSKGIKSNGMNIPKQQVQKDIENLNFFHIESGYSDFLDIARKEEVTNPVVLLATCIYNAIFNTDIKVDAELARNGYK